jgi:hypothetical protein
MNMRRRFRIVAGLASLLQGVLPAAVALADARLEARPTAPVHVESHSSSACAVVHPDNCALCQFLSAFHPSGAIQTVRLPEPSVRRAPVPDGVLTFGVTRFLSRLARAPPFLA